MIHFYHVKNFCKDDISLIENYDKAIIDSNQTWECHHRREITIPKKQLLEIGEYYNRPASELIFLTKSEHRSLHHKDKQVSDETKLKMSIAHKNMSEETRKKMSIAKQGTKLSEEHKQKIGEYSKMSHWYNNGIKNVFVKECPEGFVKGMLKRKKYD